MADESAIEAAGSYTTREISHDEAREIAQRLINSHFRQEPHARVGIPARPDYDDDLLIVAYIRQQERAALAAAQRVAGEDGAADLLMRLRRSTCFGYDVCRTLPCACAEALARQREPESKRFDGEKDLEQFNKDHPE